MKIGLCNRDFEVTGKGGDIYKMLYRKDVFNKHGHNAVIINPQKFDITCDIYHVYNLPQEWTWELYQLIKSTSKPFLIETIYFKNDFDKEKQRELIENVNRLIMFSSKEKQIIEQYLNIEIDDKISYMVNGVPDEFYNQNLEDRDIDVVAVQTRYFERKNLERLSDACKGLRLCLIGEDCRKIAAYKHYDFLSHKELNDIYNRSKVVAAVGYDDPFSNTIKEGISCGCNAVYAKQSYCDWGEDRNCFVCDAFNTEDIKESIKKALLKTPKKIRVITYKEQMQKLIDIYKQIIDETY